MRISLGLDGDVQFDREIRRIKSAVTDARPAFDQMAEAVRLGEVSQFRTQGKFASGGWAPRSPKYGEFMARNFPGRGILFGPDRPGHKGGQLRGQLTRRPFGVEHLAAQTMEIGVTLPYAAAHQRGLNGLKRRRPLELNTATRRNLVQILQRFVMTGKTNS